MNCKFLYYILSTLCDAWILYYVFFVILINVLILKNRLSADGQEFFTSYDEVYDSFDAMGLQENLLRGIYAYGMANYFSFLSSIAYLILVEY